jgi:hypothetical protein
MPAELRGTLDVALAVAAALEGSSAPYFLGGSLASSLQGEPRSTNDIDLVIDLREDQVGAFAGALGADFDVDESALRDAIRTRGSWNIFHLPSMVKVDLFIVGLEPFDKSEFARRRRVRIRPDAELFVKSPEDTVLRKLRWYADGGRTSERQWRDVVEVLRISGPALDDHYLDEWAPRLDVTADLTRARLAAALP